MSADSAADQSQNVAFKGPTQLVKDVASQIKQGSADRGRLGPRKLLLSMRRRQCDDGAVETKRAAGRDVHSVSKGQTGHGRASFRRETGEAGETQFRIAHRSTRPPKDFAPPVAIGGETGRRW